MATLETERLLLRPFRRHDVGEFARLAGDWAVARMTSDIPYPFSKEQALVWLKPVRGEVRFCIEHQGRLIGGAGFYRRASGAAELGFWLGRPWWGQGFATEAARAVLAHGARSHRLPGFSSAHFADNPASRNVLMKLGFEPVARGVIACAARGYDVEAVTYWLDRQHALMAHPPVDTRPARLERWRAFISRAKRNFERPKEPSSSVG